MPLVSVIVPVYNAEKYLEKCIDSILNQTFADFELLLVDDGSTDKSAGMCDDYQKKDKRILVEHIPNRGQGAARNVMLKKAKGKYILFIDCDDWISKDLLRTTVELAETKNLDMVLFGIEAVDESGNKLYETKCNPEHKLLLMSPGPCNKLIRKDIINNNFPKGLFPTDTWYEDLRGIAKLYYYVKSYEVLPDKFYNYVIRKGSTMRNGNAEKTVNDRITAVNDVVDFYRQKSNYRSIQFEIEWIAIMDGFLTPGREIIHFNNYHPMHMHMLKENLKRNVKGLTVSAVFKNKYFKELTRKEKLVLISLYFGGANILRTLLVWRGKVDIN